MGRLFETKPAGAAEDPTARLKRAQAVSAAIDAVQTDGAAKALGEKLAAPARGVLPMKYEQVRFGKWLIEYGRAGDDLFLQLHPLKQLVRSHGDIITAFIAVMDRIFPGSVQIYYKRPDEKWEIKFFTIRLEDVCKQPGWERARDRALEQLGRVNAWGAPGGR